MSDRIYRAVVDVTLSDTMDESPLLVLSGVILGALGEVDVAVENFTVSRRQEP